MRQKQGRRKLFTSVLHCAPVREGSTDGTGLERRVRSYIFIVLLRPLVPLQVLKIIIFTVSGP